MEVRPEPAWRVRFTVLRNKDLLAPDYGAMHVAAFLEGTGRPFEVVNLVADVHRDASLFYETNTVTDEFSGARVSEPAAAAASRAYLFEALATYQPDVILFPLSIYYLALYVRGLLRDIREACPGATIIAGGIYATLHPDEILQDGAAEIVIRGEGEVTTSAVLDALEAGEGMERIEGISYRRDGEVLHNPRRAAIPDLDVLSHPYTVSERFKVKERFDILSSLNPEGDYIPGGGFLTSRGCPEACSFCLDPALNGQRVRFHSPDYVRDVVGYCADHFTGGAGSFFFGDATFTMNRKRMRQVLERIADLPYSYQIQTRADYLDADTVRRLADCRFTTVAIGAETFNEQVLQEVAHKRLRVQDVLDAALAVQRAGMQPVLTFIIGLPGEERDSVLRTVEILKSNGLTTATFFPLVVFRGTALYGRFEEMVPPADRDALRLNPMSEEFLFVGDRYSTREELTSFTEQVNADLVEARAAS